MELGGGTTPPPTWRPIPVSTSAEGQEPIQLDASCMWTEPGFTSTTARTC